MNHLQTFIPRQVLNLPTAEIDGWQLKRYAIVAKGREYDPDVVSASLRAASKILPAAGRLSNPDGNHGVGFQIIHFAQLAVVSPVFYWMWGSVLANAEQMKAQWDSTETFDTGVTEVVGCVWELEVVNYETQCWKQIMLSGLGEPAMNLERYLGCAMPSEDIEWA